MTFLKNTKWSHYYKQTFMDFWFVVAVFFKLFLRGGSQIKGYFLLGLVKGKNEDFQLIYTVSAVCQHWIFNSKHGENMYWNHQISLKSDVWKAQVCGTKSTQHLVMMCKSLSDLLAAYFNILCPGNYKGFVLSYLHAHVHFVSSAWTAMPLLWGERSQTYKDNHVCDHRTLTILIPSQKKKFNLFSDFNSCQLQPVSAWKNCHSFSSTFMQLKGYI
jgi:hypothetical protein